ncbi:hypothetical protein M1M40_gp29 [Halorubrum tailed virus 29]|uniref:Uncharacterized protein n=1 Tax=Halorubrum tailed virus 29 TaxID=2878010 RepID=A0AAE8XZP5_9CAUD|nr:hypothetical protein M1M40_gp29 [Halorubrum tailed virus 29]UBF23307.1 hypothetical protein HRTV-29_gp29 [Halorubrum tailed virus 29]
MTLATYAALGYLLPAGTFLFTFARHERRHNKPRYDIALVVAVLWPLAVPWAIMTRILRWMDT